MKVLNDIYLLVDMLEELSTNIVDKPYSKIKAEEVNLFIYLHKKIYNNIKYFFDLNENIRDKYGKIINEYEFKFRSIANRVNCAVKNIIERERDAIKKSVPITKSTKRHNENINYLENYIANNLDGELTFIELEKDINYLSYKMKKLSEKIATKNVSAITPLEIKTFIELDKTVSKLIKPIAIASDSLSMAELDLYNDFLDHEQLIKNRFLNAAINILTHERAALAKNKNNKLHKENINYLSEQVDGSISVKLLSLDFSYNIDLLNELSKTICTLKNKDIKDRHIEQYVSLLEKCLELGEKEEDPRITITENILIKATMKLLEKEVKSLTKCKMKKNKIKHINNIYKLSKGSGLITMSSLNAEISDFEKENKSIRDNINDFVPVYAQHVKNQLAEWKQEEKSKNQKKTKPPSN